jgi:hypothetical protein
MYYKENQRLEEIISRKVKFGKNGEIVNIGSLINSDDLKLLLTISKGLIEYNIIPIHKEGINTCVDIINQINKELK